MGLEGEATGVEEREAADLTAEAGAGVGSAEKSSRAPLKIRMKK